MIAVAVIAIVSRVAAGLLSLATVVSFLLYLFDKADFSWPLFWWAVGAWVASVVFAVWLIAVDD